MRTIKVKNLSTYQKEYLIKKVKEDTDRFFNELPNNESYTIIDNEILIPAFINFKGNTVELLWISKDFRRKGYGKFLVNHFKIKYTEAYHKSIPFWESLGFYIINSKGPICMKKI